MDVLLLVLHAAFFAPIAWRLTGRFAPDASEVKSTVGGRTALAPRARPILMLHGSGLVLLYVGLFLALEAGRIARTLTGQGAIGAVIIVLADILMAWSFMALHSWRLLPKVEAGHELCTTGPYEFVRHPMYLAINLLGVGSAVWVPTPVVALATVLLMIGGDLRARAEERVLLEAFADRYRSYMRRVRRTLPGVY